MKLKSVTFALLAACTLAQANGTSTPLLEATYQGDAARVAELLRSGADVNEANILVPRDLPGCAARDTTC